MAPEDRERLVRVEVGIDNLTKLLENYVEKPCIERGCELHDDVQSLKRSHENTQKTVWVLFTACVSAIAAFLFKV